MVAALSDSLVIYCVCSLFNCRYLILDDDKQRVGVSFVLEMIRLSTSEWIT